MYILSPDGLFYAFCGCPGALQTLLQGMGGLVLAQRRAAWCAIRQRTLRQVLEYLPQSTIRHSVCRPPCLRGCLVLSVHHLGGSVGGEVAVAGKPFRDAKGRSVWCGGVGFLERDKKSPASLVCLRDFHNYKNVRRGLFAPVHLSHAHVALVTLLGHFLASVEEVCGFGRVLLHDGSKADFTLQVVLETIPVRLLRV